MMKEVKEAFCFVCSSECWRMVLFWSIALVSSYLQLLRARVFGSKATPISCSINPHNGSSRPICVITGATSGIGKATAFALAEKGFYVVLVGRSSQLLSETLKEIKNKNKDAQLKSFEADISSFESIFKFKNSLEQWLSDSELHPSIQLLVNNAGILATSSRPTIDGYDRMIATNYIGPFSLTKLLLPLLKNSYVPSRVVNVTSFTHRSAFIQKFNKDSVTGVCFSTSNQYPCARIYEYSKLCLLLFSYELHRQLRLLDDSRHVSVIAADPGFVKTNIMRELPCYITSMVFLGFRILGLLQSPDDGAESIIDAALSTWVI
ncbi:dehydrogenase/reductase SDR family member on chromosome X isoform X2 [Arabidopsis lyrata subsp. lyrata]|uniref:dehydrogenase/reductase SDR family member on chromosome X isoform X2 n=1 Tax=Arabidopsis lyrata subsp. lyrata TaxID=81972 RepID=UPI000A29D3E1|nr:dehydrogenase/reductase SDR family member on chromosome X isoform X2 [Arabidopsis lyrata subsp. lyrata]|eukprot:XP_020876594.1 dehydrogenase/reductase SDR family member on chromosome X isoform X2 [Arabidopsis lyrata subsp. lyrata]